MKVKRILPFRLRRMVGPFIFMDHAGPINNPLATPADMDVLPHPHIGLSTVSYLFGGAVTHRDSLGVEQIIRPGEVNWMTAGSGIAHSERFEDPASLAGGLEMIQTWVALPERDEEAAPSFTNYKPEQLPIFTDKGIWMRLIAGNAYGLKNDVHTNSPLFYLHVVLQQGARFGLPQEHAERGFYVVKGAVEINGVTYGAGKMLVFTKGVDPRIVAKEEATTLMLLGGEPLGERFIWWNFVSSRKERIEQAKEDWKQGRFILPPNDHSEFIPLPNDKSRPSDSPPRPEPLS
ncbi:pirin family protein [Parapedobacter sp. 10938]|uniref:pirin family protein n=1 Tax=Parapedobacter flavus TaxID=3110225 RepID=UPI002DBD3C20|nr:pirin family protein [Parapedobacter sp. 10938]MEC3880389.1 pirin family protein [Parapedobacter sp. 10938]